MTVKRDGRGRRRDYKKEYERDHSTPGARKNRALRNKARRVATKEGRVKKGDGKEIDHKRPLSKGGSNRRSNQRVVSRKVNRKKGAR